MSDSTRKTPDAEDLDGAGLDGADLGVSGLGRLPSVDSGDDFSGDALVIVTQAFCHHGHALIVPDNATFLDFPGVRVHVNGGGSGDDVVLSPIQGDHGRVGGDAFADGTACEVRCPVCDEELPTYAACPCGDGKLRLIYLTPKLTPAHVVAVCDIWGCHRSRIVGEAEIIGELVEMEVAQARGERPS